MTSMNRRGFLKVVLGSAIASAVPITLAKIAEERLPMVYGDGVHDDTEGLQAALDGKKFACANGCIIADANGSVILSGGYYRTTSTLHLGRNASIRGSVIHNAIFEGDVPPGESVFNVRASSDALIGLTVIAKN